jgi:hypothetical protein
MAAQLGREDNELMNIELTLNGVGGNPMEARGIVSMQLAVGSKSLSIAFFVDDMQSNYIVILSHDWIHANCCVPSTLHQLLIKWIDDEIKVVHVDASTYITLADATTDWQHGSAQCLLGKDFIGYDFLSIMKDGFVPMSVQPASEARLSDVIF